MGGTMDRLAIRRMLRSHNLFQATARHQLAFRAAHGNSRLLSTVPRVAEVSFWKSLIPKPLRRENRVRDPNAPKIKSKEWNPATFFIVIFLLIGSMSIQMISLRKNFEAFTRRSDVRIGLLREVVEKIQNGEKVDVEKVLGTGDPEKEAAWEEVLNEIENDNPSRSQRKQEKPKPKEAPTPTRIVAVAEPKADTTSPQEPPRGRTTYFF